MRALFCNHPIEFYSPTTGGALSTIIAAVTAELELRGHEIAVASYTDGSTAHTPGQLIDLGRPPSGRSPWERALGRAGVDLRARRYRSALRRGAARRGDDVAVFFNDYEAAQWWQRRNPTTTTLVWLQNDQDPGAADIAAARVITCSSYIRDTAIARGAQPERVLVVPSGVDREQFTAAGALPHDGFTALCIGRLDPNKGHDVALRAVLAARAAGIPVVPTLVGARWWYDNGAPDAYETELQGLLAEGCGTSLGLLGRAEVPKVFRNHDLVFVLSRSQEPFGLVALEAMASGCAVIASPRGGLPEACGGAAVLVDPDDQGAVNSATIEALSAPGRLAALQQAAIKRAESASWSVTVDALERAVLAFAPPAS